MWNAIFLVAVLLGVGGNVFAQLPEDAQEVTTRFGTLTVDAEKTLLLNGRTLSPALVGNNGLNLGEPIHMAATDVVLVHDSGGIGCPSMYYFVTVTKSGARATKPFGTCGGVWSVKYAGDTIRVMMTGFRGPSEPEAVQLRAARQQHVFVFRGGVLTKNGKILK